MSIRFCMQWLLVAVFATGSFALCAQKNNSITIGSIDSIDSKILKEKRKIWVHVPEGGPVDIYTKQRYPVVYLLDGDAHFSSVVGMIEQLSTINGNMICPNMIVVAIPNTDRTRDLTPTHVVVDPPFMDSASSKNSGGGEQFISFIEKELIPHIDSIYPTQPYRTFIGHSFGGLAVIQTLIHHTHLFNAYIAIDPSMWWDHQRLLNEAKKTLEEKKFSGIRLYMGIANTMDDGMDIKKVAKDTSGMTKHIRSILALNSYLEANKQNGLIYQSKYYQADTHGSVPLITEYDALHFIFDFYNMKVSTKDYMDSTTVLADKYESHFANVSKQMGYKVSPSESMINSFGYDALNSRHFKKAASFFKLNVANYPESYNVFDSYGDYYMAVKDTANAVANFKKALSLKENEGTRIKLEELKGAGAFIISTAALQQYTGEFDLNGMNIKTYVKDNLLRLFVAGQPEYELTPVKLHEFKIKGLSGYSVRFEMENDKPAGLFAIQPNGTFKATLKKPTGQ